MRLRRREFLLLTGLASGLGLAGLGKWLTTYQMNSDAATPLPPSRATTKPLLRFVAIADTGTGGSEQYAVAEAMTRFHQRQPFPLVVLAGDNIYTNGEIEKVNAVFERPYQALLQRGVKVHACLGNHDIRTANGEPQIRYPGFNMQGRYYTFRRGTVQFFALDTNPNADWHNQLPWLEQELRQSQAPWKVVFGHHPLYSSGRYGSNSALIDALTPLFKTYRVQLYINGHEHSYERTEAIDGTTYLIVGNAGAALRSVGRSPWTERAASRYGFTVLEVYPDFIEVTAVGTDEQLFDRGSIDL
ncbi:metallophosphoesterase family protein [Pantanalinema rosaneae CENA516]|uniref:metallophosphoesterase family protein n=1 Tax=Pantanalinema rosaneae TaxID=1620701 RepID=UPI003D6E88AC